MAAVAVQNPNPTPQAVPAGAQNFASLYVGDLHLDVSEAQLFEIFNAVGPVASIRVCRDSVTRRSLGYAYVNFMNVADAERCISTMNYSAIKDRSCRIMWSSRDPATRKTGTGNVFVKNLDRNIDNKALYETFSLFGNILSCKVASDENGKSFGYGFVHYETEDAADQAISRVNGMRIGEKTVFVGPFVKREQREQGEKKFTNIYVKNLPAGMTEESLRTLLAAFGEITSCIVQADNKGRMFGFCNFATFDQAAAAVEALHGKDMRESKEGDATEEDLLYCQRAQSKAERVAQLKSEFQGNTRPDTGVNLYIKNLDDSVDDEKLKELFQSYGNVVSAKVMRDEKNLSRGFGFVSFSASEDATRAVTEMHLKLIAAKPLYVGLAEKREVRQARLQERYRMPRPQGQPNMAANPAAPMFYNPAMRPQGMNQPGMMWPRPNMRPMQPFNMQVARPLGMMPRPKMMAQGRPGMNQFNYTAQARNKQAPGAGGPGFMQNGMEEPKVAPFDPKQPLSAAALAAAPPGMQKQMLGEKLFPLIANHQPVLAGKITGMMLEMDNSELLILLESDTQLKAKVDEAMRVIEGNGKN